MSTTRPLKVFLCHASADKPAVRELYNALKSEGWIDPWLDEEKLLPGQDWDMEIEKAVETTDAVIVFLSNNSITKEGFVQKELRSVLDVAEYKPEGVIFIIPLRLENCIVPRRLKNYQYQDYFPTERIEKAFKRLLNSLKLRAEVVGVDISEILNDLRREAEEKAKKVQELRIRKEAEEKIRREEEEAIRIKAEERARKALERKLRKQAEEKVRREKEEREQREAAEKARVEEIAKQKAEELYKKTNNALQFEWNGDLESALEVYYEIRTIDPTYPNVESKINELEKEIRVREENLRREAEELARKQAEEKARRDKEELDRNEAEERANRDAEENARKIKEFLAQKQAEEKARREIAERENAEKIAREKAIREAKQKKQVAEPVQPQAEQPIRRPTTQKQPAKESFPVWLRFLSDHLCYQRG